MKSSLEPKIGPLSMGWSQSASDIKHHEIPKSYEATGMGQGRPQGRPCILGEVQRSFSRWAPRQPDQIRSPKNDLRWEWQKSKQIIKKMYLYTIHIIYNYIVYIMCILYICNILPRIDEWTTMIGTTSRIQLVAIAHNNYKHTNKTKKRIRCKPTVTMIWNQSLFMTRLQEHGWQTMKKQPTHDCMYVYIIIL